MKDQNSVQERYELKYVVSVGAMDLISKMLEMHCTLDPYSQDAPEYFYPSSSLYLDNKNFQLSQKSDLQSGFGVSMRIRSYGADLQAPYYFEIKYKVRDFVRKKRSRVFATNWSDVLNAEDFPYDLSVESKKNLEEFIYLSRSYACVPAVRVEYRRKAYLSKAGDNARVTFDQDVQLYAASKAPSERPERSLSEGSVVLKLRYEKRMPPWMLSLIETFELSQKPGSQYGDFLLR